MLNTRGGKINSDYISHVISQNNMQNREILSSGFLIQSQLILFESSYLFKNYICAKLHLKLEKLAQKAEYPDG